MVSYGSPPDNFVVTMKIAEARAEDRADEIGGHP